MLRECRFIPSTSFGISTGRSGRCPVAVTIRAWRGARPPAQPGHRGRGGGGCPGASLPAGARDLPALLRGDGVAKNAAVNRAQAAASACLRGARKAKGNYSSSVLMSSSYSVSEPKEMAVALCGS